ncbi:hypothetical protein Tco_1569138 [Tanacetum coccineum]
MCTRQDIHTPRKRILHDPQLSSKLFFRNVNSLQTYSLRSSRNGECSNCKHLRGKIECTQGEQSEMHIASGNNSTFNSAALFHEVLNEWKIWIWRIQGYCIPPPDLSSCTHSLMSFLVVVKREMRSANASESEIGVWAAGGGGWRSGDESREMMRTTGGWRGGVFALRSGERYS